MKLTLCQNNKKLTKIIDYIHFFHFSVDEEKVEKGDEVVRSNSSGFSYTLTPLTNILSPFLFSS